MSPVMLAVERQHAVNISTVTGRYLSLNRPYVSPGAFILTDLLQTQQLRRSLSINAIKFGAYVRRLPVVTKANCRALNQSALCQLKTFSSSLVSLDNRLTPNELCSKYPIFGNACDVQKGLTFTKKCCGFIFCLLNHSSQ